MKNTQKTLQFEFRDATVRISLRDNTKVATSNSKLKDKNSTERIKKRK